MLRIKLQEIIPEKVDKFPKFERGEPYHFDRWEFDNNGEFCLYYWFWKKKKIGKNKKRVVISEVVSLLNFVLKNKIILFPNKLFKKICPVTQSAGPCGFTVTVWILECLGIAKYERRKGFRILDWDLVKLIIST